MTLVVPELVLLACFLLIGFCAGCDLRDRRDEQGMGKMTPDLSSLIERCKAATKGDREIDADICRLWVEEVWNYNGNAHIDAQIRSENWVGSRENHPDFEPEEDARITWRFRNGNDYGEVPAYTSDLNAIVGLIEKTLDHAAWDIKHGFGYTATVWFLETDYDEHPVPAWSTQYGAALALCTAFLMACASTDPRTAVAAKESP